MITHDTLSNETFVKLWDLLNEQGAKLLDNLRAGYTRGYEDELTRDLLGRLSEQQRDEALVILADQKMMNLAGVDCLLDECAAESYEATSKMAGVLVDAIRAQDNRDGALRQLVVDEITSRARLQESYPDLFNPDATSADSMTVKFS